MPRPDLPRRQPPRLAGPTLARRSDLQRRELSLLELLAIAWKVYWERFTAIVAVAIGIAAPVQLVLLRHWHGKNALEDQQRFFLELIFETVFGVLTTIAIAQLTVRTVHGEEPLGFRRGLRAVVGRYQDAIVTGAVARAVILGGALLLFVPGLIAFVALAFTEQIVALRGKTGFEALRASYDVVQGRWLKVLVVATAPLTVALILQDMVAPLLNDDFTPSFGLEFVLAMLGQVPAAFQAVLLTVLFLNLEATRAQATTEREPPL